VRVAEPTAALHEITGRALESGTTLVELAVERPTLEDAYLALADGDASGALRPLTEEGGDRR